MNRSRLRAACVALVGFNVLAVSVAAVAPSWAQEATGATQQSAGVGSDGVIIGRLHLESPGDADLSGAEVLAVPIMDGSPGEPITVTVGATGVFTLTGLAVGDEVSYRIVASFEGEDYLNNEDVVLTAAEPLERDVTMTVYSTDSDVGLEVTNGHILVTPRPENGSLRVAEVWIVNNDTLLAAVAGDDGATIRMVIPEGASQITFADPRLRNGASLDGDELLIDAGFLPGATELAISYDVPYMGTEAILAHAIDLPVEAIQVIAMAAEASIESDSLGPSHPMVIDSGTIVVAEGESIPAGDLVTVRVVGLPAALEGATAQEAMQEIAEPIVGQDVLAWLGLGVALVGVLGALAYPLGLARSGHGRRQRLEAEYDSCVDSLVSVETRHASGELMGPAYAAERASLIGRAIQLARAMDEQEGSQ